MWFAFLPKVLYHTTGQNLLFHIFFLMLCRNSFCCKQNATNTTERAYLLLSSEMLPERFPGTPGTWRLRFPRRSHWRRNTPSPAAESDPPAEEKTQQQVSHTPDHPEQSGTYELTVTSGWLYMVMVSGVTLTSSTNSRSSVAETGLRGSNYTHVNITHINQSSTSESTSIMTQY